MDRIREVRRIVLFSALLCAGPAWAEKPATARSRSSSDEAPQGILDIEHLSLELGFEARYERRRTITDGDGRYNYRYRQLNEEREFRETLGFHATGSAFGDRVLRFDIGARWGLIQERFYERRPGVTLDHDAHGDLLEYDFRLDFLPAGKISASVYGSQLDDRLPRPFLPSLDRTRERYGVTLLFNDRTLPMRLSFEHSFDDIRGGADRFDNERFGTDSLEYEVTWQITEHHSLQLLYEYEDRKEQYSGLGTEFSTRRHYLTLDHALHFGPEHRHNLNTLFRYQDETGDLARDTIELAPRLRLQHTKALATTYGLQYLRETYADFRIRQWRGDWGLIHQSDIGLTTTLNLYALRQDTEDLANRGGGIDTTDWGGTANLSYARENPLGRFHANLSYTHNRVRTSDDRQGGIVIDETVTFRDPLPVYLEQDNILNYTVIVMDPTRQRIYVAGRDYVVVPLGQVTALVRIRSGRINDGDTVTVSYRYRGFDDYELSRDRIDFRAQQDFDSGLSTYYAGLVQDEDLSRSAYQSFRARNVNRHRVGFTYRKPKWSVGGEFEYNDETIDPFTAIHLNGDLTILQDARQNLSGRLRLSRFCFDGTNDFLERHTTLFDANLSYSYVLGPNFDANATASYRYETDSIFGRTNGVDISGTLAHTVGLFSTLLTVEYDVLDLPGSSDNTFGVWLKLRREIPIIGKPRGPRWASR